LIAPGSPPLNAHGPRDDLRQQVKAVAQPQEGTRLEPGTGPEGFLIEPKNSRACRNCTASQPAPRRPRCERRSRRIKSNGAVCIQGLQILTLDMRSDSPM